MHALDSIELLVRELAGRDLEASCARGPDGAVRVAWRSPSWTDMLARLDAAVRAAHPDGTPEHAAALQADRLGLGLVRERRSPAVQDSRPPRS